MFPSTRMCHAPFVMLHMACHNRHSTANNNPLFANITIFRLYVMWNCIYIWKRWRQSTIQMKKCCVTKWRRCCGVCRNQQKSASVSSIYPLSSHMKCRDDTIRRPRAVNTRYENRMRHNKANQYAAYAECGDAENENRQIERAKTKRNSKFFQCSELYELTRDK